jgi:hypothetical protein
MRIWKAARWVALFVVLAVAATAVAIYVLASRVPPDYRPARLTQPQKERAAKEFVNDKVFRGFSNPAQANEPFRWHVTEEQLNRYIASMDEIVSLLPGRDPGDVYARLEEAGLADPGLALGDGTLTLMVRDKRREKILSVRLAVEMTDGRLRVRLAGARVGRVAVPRSVVAGQIEELKAYLEYRRSQGQGDKEVGGLSAEALGRLLAGVVEAVGEEPIDPVFTGGINNRRVRVTGVTIERDRLTLELAPADRPDGG